MQKRIFGMAVYSLLVMLMVQEVSAQGYATKPYAALEIYGGLGTTSYFGDVGGKDGSRTGLMAVADSWGVDIEQTRLTGVVGFRYIRNKTLALNAQFKPMWIAGSDKNSQLETLGRKFEFNSYGADLSLVAELFLANRLTGAAPYLAGGLGLGFFNVNYFDQQVNMEDPSIQNWINNLSPYPGGLDMERWTGMVFTPVLELGFGVRLPSLSRNMTQNVELRYHYSFKDAIDGYSIGVLPGKSNQYGKMGDTFLTVTYQVVLDVDKTFVYDHKGRINR